MFTEEITAMAGAAKAKCVFLKNNLPGYIISSMLAGVFVGIGVLLAYTVGSLLSDQPYARIATGASFGVALSLIVVAGAELFTGNNMVMTAGMLKKTVMPAETLRLWAICYIGNWCGAILLSVLFLATGLADTPTGEYMASLSAVKVSLPFLQLLSRGIFCNFLVCMAVWCSFRSKSESGRLIMIFWCLFAFVTTGFEHSIANMILLTVSLFAPAGAAAIGPGGYFYNILTVTLGNMIGGILFAGIPYAIISGKD